MTLLAEIALVVLAAVAVTIGVALLPKPVRTIHGRRAPVSASRPEQLIRLERLVGMSATDTLQAHAYLRPLLVEISQRRLAASGRSLEQMSDADGARLLGDRLWDLVRPNRPFPEDRDAPGIAPRELARMLEVLERL